MPQQQRAQALAQRRRRAHQADAIARQLAQVAQRWRGIPHPHHAVAAERISQPPRQVTKQKQKFFVSSSLRGNL